MCSVVNLTGDNILQMSGRWTPQVHQTGNSSNLESLRQPRCFQEQTSCTASAGCWGPSRGCSHSCFCKPPPEARRGESLSEPVGPEHRDMRTCRALRNALKKSDLVLKPIKQLECVVLRFTQMQKTSLNPFTSIQTSRREDV